MRCSRSAGARMGSVSFLLLWFLVPVQSCSCMHPVPLAADEPLRSPSLKFMQSPLVFAGRVVSVKAVEEVPNDDRFECKEGTNFCMSADRWARCSQGHQAVVEVTNGLKGIQTGEHFVYNCTQASCGDCSPPCPEVNSHILDATVMGGAQHLCGRQICTLGSPAPYDHCDQLLLELHRARPALSAPLQLPLPLPFALWSDRFLRNDALRTLQEEVLEALTLSNTDEVNEFDLWQMDLVPASADAGALTVAEVRFHFPTPEEANETVKNLLEIKGWDFPRLKKLRLTKLQNLQSSWQHSEPIQFQEVTG